MITNKDLDIQNISYTNKDFGQIYPELVELAKKLTNKWDPEDTNESDPGIVLLKIAAFLGDKLNYNIDKNTLEQFIVSATQETSVRRLTEMLGYYMKYYNSATTKVNFRYLGTFKSATDEETTSEDATNTTNSVENLDSFVIKAFDTELKTSDNIVYTLLEDIQVDTLNKQISGKLAIQGQLKNLTVLGSDNYSDSNLIQLYNLDDQNRLYFPDAEVAENGIFINKEVYSLLHQDYWHRVTNLNDQDLGSKVFLFGYDSDKKCPYIQFPSDIADLIGDGLQISYIISSGQEGKVSTNKLSSFSKIKITKTLADNTAYLTELSDDLYVLGNSLSTSGSNPESITEAYNNFKKTIGTFNTLVSCKDYSNYLNTYFDSSNNRLVSAVNVTDARTDPYYSTKLFTRDQSGVSYYTTSLTDFGRANPYDLILHGTLPVNQNIISLSLYNRTYNSLTDSNVYDITQELNTVKSINHNITTPKNNLSQINFIEADYILKSNITTKYKVNIEEQKDIIKNIKSALFNDFNASKVDFGEELPYTSLLNCIQNADSRIKNVSLDEPNIIYYLKYPDNSSIEYKIIDDNNNLNFIIRDNILSGSLPIYVDSQEFSYDYTMNSGRDIDYLAGIYSEFTLPLLNNVRRLQENESIQILQDSYLTDIIYPAYVYYAFVGDISSAGQIAINKNTVYKLKPGEKLYIEYTDSSDNIQLVTYTSDDVIQPNFDIINTNGLAEIRDTYTNVTNHIASKFMDIVNKKVMGNNYTYTSWNNNSVSKENIIPLFSIGTKEEIDILRKNTVTIEKNSDIFWYIKPKVVKNNTSYTIDNEHGDLILKLNPWNNSEYIYILEEGEYIVYPSSDMTSLNILESGTKIKLDKLPQDENNEYIRIRRSQSDIILVDDLEDAMNTDDVGTFKQTFKWENINRKLTVIETSSSNYIKDTLFSCNENYTVTKDWSRCPLSISVDGDEKLFTDTSEPLIRSVLSINGSKDNPQKILDNQTVTYLSSNIYKESENTPAIITANTVESGYYIQVYPELDSYNNMISLGSVQYDDDVEGVLKPLLSATGKYLYSYPCSMFIYKEKETISTEKSLSNLILKLKDENNLTINSRDEYVINGEDLKEFIPALDSIIIDNPIDNRYYNIFNTINNEITLEKNLRTFDLSMFKSLTEPDLKTNYLYISKPKKLSLCKYLVDNNISEDVVLRAISNEPRFDIIGERNNSKLINSYQPLYSFFDSNNIYNKLTLCKLDIKNSEFNIVGSSKL